MTVLFWVAEGLTSFCLLLVGAIVFIIVQESPTGIAKEAYTYGWAFVAVVAVLMLIAYWRYSERQRKELTDKIDDLNARFIDYLKERTK